MASCENGRAASLLLVLHPPFALAAEPVVHVGHEYLSQFAFRDKFALKIDKRIEAEYESDHRADVVLLHGVYHLRDVVLVYGDGLFDEDMLARLCRPYRLFRVLAVGRADGDDVNVVVVKQLVERRVLLAVQPELRLLCADAFDSARADCRHHAVWML